MCDGSSRHQQAYEASCNQEKDSSDDRQSNPTIALDVLDLAPSVWNAEQDGIFEQRLVRRMNGDLWFCGIGQKKDAVAGATSLDLQLVKGEDDRRLVVTT